MNEQVMVSVICLAYNHEKYIAEALESFVKQKTDFPFEIIVHDDASTDKTADIIREYEKKWPDIIKPIYQTENQHTKNVEIRLNCELQRAKGMYIALCEGDDYWTDESKLQKQYDYMQAHPDCPLVAHETMKIFEDGRYMSRFSNHRFSEPNACFLDVEDVIRYVNDFHTSSLFYRREYSVRNQDFLRTIPSFDYVTKILCAVDLPGKVYVIPEIMSAYRVSAIGSWSQRIRDNAEKYQKHIQTSIDSLRKIDEYCNFCYTDAFQKEILQREFSIELVKENKYAWKDPKYKSLIAEMSLKKKTGNYLQLYMPKLFQLMRNMYTQIKKWIE